MLKRDIFTAGSRYRAKKSFMSGDSTFLYDEILIFESDGYSRYDDCFIYTFHSQTDGQKKSWWLGYGEPSTAWLDFFEPLDARR